MGSVRSDSHSRLGIPITHPDDQTNRPRAHSALLRPIRSGGAVGGYILWPGCSVQVKRPGKPGPNHQPTPANQTMTIQIYRKAAKGRKVWTSWKCLPPSLQFTRPVQSAGVPAIADPRFPPFHVPGREREAGIHAKDRYGTCPGKTRSLVHRRERSMMPRPRGVPASRFPMPSRSNSCP